MKMGCRPPRAARGPAPFFIFLKQLHQRLKNCQQPTGRPRRKKRKHFMRTCPALSNAWESTGSVLSLLQLLTTAQSELRPSGGSIHSRPMFYALNRWNTSPSLSGRSAEQFISILRLPFPGTLEVVSISQPCRTLLPLNGSITSAGENGLLESWMNSGGGRAFIVSLQINVYAAGGVSFLSLTKTPGAPDSVVARHCPFYRTRLLSPDTLAPTSRLRLALGCLATKECALFVIRSLNEMQALPGPGSTEAAAFSAADVSSWDSFMDAIPLELSVGTAPSGPGAGGESCGLSANTTRRHSFIARVSRSGPTIRRVWDFSGRSCTPFKKIMSSTPISSNRTRTARFECPECGALLTGEFCDGFAFCGRCSLEIDEHFFQ